MVIMKSFLKIKEAYDIFMMMKKENYMIYNYFLKILN